MEIILLNVQINKLSCVKISTHVLIKHLRLLFPLFLASLWFKIWVKS